MTTSVADAVHDIVAATDAAWGAAIAAQESIGNDVTRYLGGHDNKAAAAMLKRTRSGPYENWRQQGFRFTHAGKGMVAQADLDRWTGVGNDIMRAMHDSAEDGRSTTITRVLADTIAATAADVKAAAKFALPLGLVSLVGGGVIVGWLYMRGRA